MFLEADEEATSYAQSDEKTEDFYGGGGQFRKGGKEHFPQLWCANGTYSSYGQAGACSLFCVFCSLAPCHLCAACVRLSLYRIAYNVLYFMILHENEECLSLCAL